jgi:predicted transcriptional regulator
MRALVDIPDDQVGALAEIAKRAGVSRAEIIRRAISSFTARETIPADILAQTFGLWAGGEDGLAYQERMRSEW